MRVLVTRPEPDAEGTAARLELLGHEAILLPLSRIVGLEVPETDGQFDAGAASSVNSIRHCPQWLLDALHGRPVHVVGEATAAAARAAGLEVGEVCEGAASLAARIAGELQGRKVAYLCGRVRLPVFQQRMAASRVMPFEVYDTLPVEWLAEEAVQRIGAAVDAVLLYSALAARKFRSLAEHPELRTLLADARLFCLSPRIATELAGWPRVHAAARPDEASLLALLEAAAGA